MITRKRTIQKQLFLGKPMTKGIKKPPTELTIGGF